MIHVTALAHQPGEGGALPVPALVAKDEEHQGIEELLVRPAQRGQEGEEIVLAGHLLFELLLAGEAGCQELHVGPVE